VEVSAHRAVIFAIVQLSCYLNRICSLYTTAFSALRVPDDSHDLLTYLSTYVHRGTGARALK